MAVTLKELFYGNNGFLSSYALELINSKTKKTAKNDLIYVAEENLTLNSPDSISENTEESLQSEAPISIESIVMEEDKAA